jgi:hypothetical protein
MKILLLPRELRLLAIGRLSTWTTTPPSRKRGQFDAVVGHEAVLRQNDDSFRELKKSYGALEPTTAQGAFADNEHSVVPRRPSASTHADESYHQALHRASFWGWALEATAKSAA